MKKILLFCSLAVLVFSLAISAQAAAVGPKPMANQWDVLKLFQKAMGNRYGDLNSNGKSGAQGVYDCIITEYSVIPATVPPSTAPKITKTMVNTELVGNKKIYELTNPADILVWFKGKFKDVATNDPNGAILNNRDKQGIQYAMNNRFDDLCSKDWNATMSGLVQTYKTKVTAGAKAVPAVGTPGTAGYKAAVLASPSFQKVVDTTIKNCKDDYSKKIACIKGVECKDKRGTRIKYSDNITVISTTDGMTARNNQYNNSTKRYIEQEQYANERDLCIANAYKKFNEDKTTEWRNLTTANADSTMTTCLGDKKTW